MQNQNSSTLRKEIFTLPNILVYIRILLIPVFIVMYIKAQDLAGYLAAFTIMVIAFLTDFFDGRIARKYNCVTDLGKTLDPIADKLYQFSVAICLMIEIPLMTTVAVILFIKEISMGIMGLILIGKGGKIFGAKWYGKVCTAFVYLVMVFLLLQPIIFPDIPKFVKDLLIYMSDAMLIFSFIMYTRLYNEKIKELDNKEENTNV